MVDIRLFHAIVSRERECPRCALRNCRNPPVLDTMGYHAFVWFWNGGSFSQANKIRGKLPRTLWHRSILLTSHIEEALLYDSAVLGKGPTKQRRMDLMIDTLEFLRNKHGFDVTLVNRCPSHAIRIAGRTAGGAATRAGNTEFDTYRIHCAYVDMAICPHQKLTFAGRSRAMQRSP